MSNYYLSHSAAELDEAVGKVLNDYKDVSSVTATGNDVVIGKTIVDSSGNVINGSLNTDQFYSEGYTAGVIDGNNTSYSRGYDDGYDEGYDTGYDKGLEEATPTLQSKEVIPNLVEQTITADTGFDGLLSVYIQAIPKSILDAEYQKGFDEAFELYKPYKLELPYIQSTGTQYIDTGFIPKSTTRVVMDCEVTYTTDWIMIFGAYNANAYYSWWAVGSSMKPYYGSTNLTTSGDAGRMTLDANGNVWSVGGNSVTFSAQTFTATSTAYIFSVNNGGNYANASMKLYSCEIYDNGVLARDYIPVLDWENVPCLYDKVTHKLYYNAGTGTFTCSVPVKLPEGYTQVNSIQSSGTQYINSNFYPSGKELKVVTNFKYTASHDGLSLFGNATGTPFAITVYGSKPVFYVGNSNAVSCGSQTSLNTKYTLDVTADSGTLTAIWNGTKYTASYSGTLRTDRPMFIFGSNGGSGVAETGNGYLLEDIQFYDNGSLVRSYIPCITSDKIAGLYDLIEGKFYANAGSGTFTYA